MAGNSQHPLPVYYMKYDKGRDTRTRVSFRNVNKFYCGGTRNRNTKQNLERRSVGKQTLESEKKNLYRNTGTQRQSPGTRARGTWSHWECAPISAVVTEPQIGKNDVQLLFVFVISWNFYFRVSRNTKSKFWALFCKKLQIFLKD